MENAFATPTATEAPEEGPPPAIAELQAAAEQAALEIAAQEAPAERAEVEAAELPELELAEEAAIEVEEPAVPVETTAPEFEPAIDLAEVEEAGEHDIEVTEWDLTRFAAQAEAEALSAAVETVAEQQPLPEVPIEQIEEPRVEERVAEAASDDTAEVELEPETSAEEPALVEEMAAEIIESEPEKPLADIAEELAADVQTTAKRAAKKKAPAKKKAATPRTKKTATKKSADLPEDAVWLSDAVSFSLRGEWSNTWTPPEDASGAERLEVFREKAAAGDLTIWGRAEAKDAWEPVKATYWKTAFVEPLSFLMGRENVVTEPKASKAKKPVKYTALKVAQAEVEALWPPAPEATVRDAA